MFGLIREFLPILSVIVISFACGYAFRDWKSRRRRDAERKKYQKSDPSAKPTGFMKIEKEDTRRHSAAKWLTKDEM